MIYIPFSSFMLMTDLDEAMEALRRFYAHLESGGQVLIPIKVPRRLFESHGWQQWVLRSADTRARDGAEALIHEGDEYDLVEQTTTGHYKYEVFQNGELIQTYHHSMTLRWFGKYEFTLMLQKAGVRDIFVHGDYTEQEADGRHDTMVFRAWK